MSDALKGAVKSVRKGAKEKKDRVFAIRPLQAALKDAKSGDAATMKARVFTYDAEVTEALQKHLGPVLAYVDNACKQILKEMPTVNLQSPGTTLPPQKFAVTVTTATTIWDLMDSNERWKREQEEAFKKILDERFTLCAQKIMKSGEDVKADVDKYIIVANMLHAEPEQKYLDAINDSLNLFTTEIRQQITVSQNWTGTYFATWLTAHIREQKNAEKAIIQVRAAKSGVVILDSGLIAGHAAHAAASFGATAPLAIIAIVRQALDITQIMAKAAMSLDTMAKIITKEIKLVTDYYATDKPAAVGTEIILNAAKGVLGVDVPSVSTCNEHIGDYEHKIRTLSSSYNQLQRELAEWKRQLDGYKQLMKFDELHGAPPTTRKAWIDLIAATTESYLKVMVCADDKDARIDEAKSNVKDWRTALSTIEEKTGKWTKYVSKVVSVATSAGLGLGHVGGEAIESVAAIAEHTHKILIEAGVVIFEGMTGPMLERLQEVES